MPKEKRSFCVHYKTIGATNLNTNNSNEANFIMMQPMHVSDVVILIVRIIVLGFASHLD